MAPARRGRGRRRGGQIDRDASIAEFVDDAVEPAEIPTILGGLDAIPAEDGEGHGVDAGLDHQANVLVQCLLGPLVRIVVAAERDALQARASAAGIPTVVYYPVPLHRQNAYKDFPADPAGLAVSEDLASRVISLPMHPYLASQVQDRIIEVILG